MSDKPILSEIYVHKLTVQSYDLDFYNHVNNAVYLNYLESARVAFLKFYGIDFKTFLSQEAVPVVATAHLEFKHPCYMDDELSIKTWISEKKRVSMTFVYEIFNQKNELVHVGETVVVFVDRSGKAAPIPDLYLKLLKK